MNRNEDLSEPPRLLSSFGARDARYISISIASRNEPIWDEGVSAAADGGAEAAIREAATAAAANMGGDGC